MSHVLRFTPRLAAAVSSAALVAAAALVVAPPASAAAGALDATFSLDGKTLRDSDGCEDGASAVAQQLADDKLLVAGIACGDAGYSAMVQRYTAAGAPDTTFDGDGEALAAYDGEYKVVRPTATGGVVAGGVVTTESASDAVVTRFSSTGAHEMTFTRHIGGPDGTAMVEELAVAADGTITAVGTACDGSAEEDFGCRLFVMKVTSAGALDTTFDTDGLAFSDVGLYGDVALLPDGRIAFAGSDETGASSTQALRLFTSTLAPDTTFAATGSVPLAFEPYGVAVSATRVLAVGELYDEATDVSDFAAGLFDLAGAPATGFGTSGVSTIDLGGQEYALTGAVDDAGTVYLSGEDFSTTGGFLLARLTPAGTLDPTFGEGGSTRTSFGTDAYAWAAAMTLQRDGKPVLAGSAETVTGVYDVALARYEGATPHEIRYVPIAPARILDSRGNSPVTNDGIQTPLGPSGRFDMQVTGRGGVPSSGVSAVVLNVTAISPTAGGYLSAYPAGTPRPGASNLNFVAGQVVPNLVNVKLGDLGKVSLFNGSGGQTNVAVDVLGYYSDGNAPVAGGSFVPVSPTRIADSRAGRLSGDGLEAPVPAYGTVHVAVKNKGGVPATGVAAVVLNVTVTGAKAGGFLTAFPGGTARPNASNLNFKAGQTVANLVVVKAGDNGMVSLFNGSGGSTDVLVDVAGYFTDATSEILKGNFQGLTPSRVLDTRPGGGPPDVKLAPGQTIEVQIAGRGRVPATGVSAVALNVTAVAPTSSGFLTVYPADAPSRPVVSNLNFAAGQTVPNAVIVKLGANGKVKLYNPLGSTHVLFDVAGWYNASQLA